RSPHRYRAAVSRASKRWDEDESSSRSSALLEHDPFGEPLHAFRMMPSARSAGVGRHRAARPRGSRRARCRAPHHEDSGYHPEEAQSAVSKDKATDLEKNARAISYQLIDSRLIVSAWIVHVFHDRHYRPAKCWQIDAVQSPGRAEARVG